MTHEIAVAVPPHHPAFAGHFPGSPVLPGVVLLSWATKALGDALGRAAEPCTITSAKFLRPVGPGDRLVVRHSALSPGTWRFDILRGEEAVATGALRLDAP